MIYLLNLLFFISIYLFIKSKYKPNIMFDENGSYKSFGNGSKKTILYWLVTNVLILFYLFLVVRA